MGYYVRVLGLRDVPVTIKMVNAALEHAKIPSTVRIKGPPKAAIAELDVTHPDGSPICEVERNPVADGELGADEIEEFLDELDDARPASAADWLRAFLPRVEVIYAIRILSGADKGVGWDAVDAIRNCIWKAVGGIIQSDGEGFSNEAGHQIIWQFGPSVEGPWKMAILDEKGRWRAFQMELGSKSHRKAFLAGRIPKGVRPIRT